jgi:hypothetical protein
MNHRASPHRRSSARVDASNYSGNPPSRWNEFEPERRPSRVSVKSVNPGLSSKIFKDCCTPDAGAELSFERRRRLDGLRRTRHGVSIFQRAAPCARRKSVTEPGRPLTILNSGSRRPRPGRRCSSPGCARRAAPPHRLPLHFLQNRGGVTDWLRHRKRPSVCHGCTPLKNGT